MIEVAILDDYQNVANDFVDWKQLKNKINVTVFNKYIGKDIDLAEQLKGFEILCLMRERTPLTKVLISKLPNLKLVITSGMWNASIDNGELKKRNIILCGTDTEIHPTAELTWALIMMGWRGLRVEPSVNTSMYWCPSNSFQLRLGRFWWMYPWGWGSVSKMGSMQSSGGRLA